jgi:succinoglycan biosynthesis transport protein ExoP
MEPTTQQPPDLRVYWTWLRRSWLVILLCVALAIGVAALAWSSLPKTYQATTAALVTPPVSGGQSVNMDTELQVVKSATVARLAAENLGAAEQVGSIRPRLDLFVPPNSTVLEITYNGSSPEASRDGAQAVADAYLTVREQAARTQIDAQVASLQAQRDAFADEASQLRSTLSDQDPESATAQRIQVELDTILRRIAQIDTDIASLTTTSVTPGVVITEAQLPSLPASPNPILLFASATMLGLLLGLALAVLRGIRRDRTISGLDQLRDLPGVSYVGDVSDVSHDRPGQFSPATRRDIERVVALTLRERGQGGSMVMVTSPVATPISSAVSLALGGVAVGRGGRGLLVIASNQSGTLRRTNGNTIPALTSLTQGREGTQWEGNHLPRVDRVPVTLATPRAGEWAPLVWDNAYADALSTVIKELVVVVEAPPLSDSSDGFTIAQAAAIVVLVVPRGTATKDVASATSQLSATDAPVVALLGPEPASAVDSGTPAGTRSSGSKRRGKRGDSTSDGAQTLPAETSDATRLTG